MDQITQLCYSDPRKTTTILLSLIRFFAFLCFTFVNPLTTAFSIDRFSRDAAHAALKEGQQHLTVLTRQSAISRLYPSAQSVMDVPTTIV